MFDNIKKYATYPILVVALGIIFLVGHRHWFAPAAPTPEVVIEQPIEQPVVKPAKKKTKKVKNPRKTQPTQPVKPQPKPKTRPYRECDENGYCWTHF